MPKIAPPDRTRRPLLAVTPGDPDGIGYEITWKILREAATRTLKADLLCVGAERPFKKIGAPIEKVSLDELQSGKRPTKRSKPTVWLLPAPTRSKLHLAGYQSGWSVETATKLVQTGVAAAVVTGPISKERLQKGGFGYMGHTDMLADLCRTPQVTMMLANDQLRVALVTTHIALKDVPKALSRKSIRRAVLQTAASLQNWWGIKKPRIAVAALNPHAGESGLLGKEEQRTISPALERLKKTSRGGFQLFGPLPADTLFAQHRMAKAKDRYDAVVCMYHDQGLIPVKLLDFPNTVNITLGLPIIRTSVDHGVGFDIAGTGKADPSSLRAALKLALHLVRHQR